MFLTIETTIKCFIIFCTGSPSVFPRINVRDPYKRLGISREASEEEIREAHSFLTRQYSGHEKSRASIEAAYDKIIMESLRERRRPKIDIQSTLKQKYAQLPPWLRNVSNIYDVPSSKVILTRAIFFAFLGVWSILYPTQIGPAFQVSNARNSSMNWHASNYSVHANNCVIPLHVL
jgi:hypothetical protein